MITIHSEKKSPQYVEVVERKGLGHPDTLADTIAERVSCLYSKYIYENFGQRFAHHWFDKVVLVGGESRIEYGFGEIIKPYQVIIFGKAVRKVGEVHIPIEQLFWEASVQVLSKELIGFDEKKHLVVVDKVVDYKGPGQKRSRYRPEKIEDLVLLEESPQRSNDCNLCIGYAPLTKLEHMVLSLECFLTSAEFKEDFGNCSGSDIKIVGERTGEKIRILLNIPFLAHAISSWSQYLQKIQYLETLITRWCYETHNVHVSELSINPESRHGRPYLTVLGSVADTGDVGIVGRGNRYNGLITPTRGMSIEAWAGKNPIDHTGKLYTVLASSIASSIFKLIGFPVEVILTSSKEASLEQPDLVAITINCDQELGDGLHNSIKDLVRQSLSSVSEISLSAIFGSEQTLGQKAA